MGLAYLPVSKDTIFILKSCLISILTMYHTRALHRGTARKSTEQSQKRNLRADSRTYAPQVGSSDATCPALNKQPPSLNTHSITVARPESIGTETL